MNRFAFAFVCLFCFASPSFAAIDLNTATQAELEALDGIGPVKAKAIIAYRTKNGPFKSVGQLDKVKGFGKASVKKIKGDVTVGKTTIKQEVIGKPAETKKP